MNKKRIAFYSLGLQFECTQCGKCCMGSPGYVWLSEQDIVNISGFLKLSSHSFLSTCTRPVTIFGERRVSLIERSDYSCIFWKDICTVYPARPFQCRSYPFWKRNLISHREWLKEGHKCPGIDRGTIHTREEINRLINNVPNYDITRFSDRLQDIPQ